LITLYDSKTTIGNFNNNGLVILSECKSFITTEKNNDTYEIEFTYPIDSYGKWKYILNNNIVKNSQGQLFRIYHKHKVLDGIQVNARHIFYDLLKNNLEDVRPTNINGAGALNWILSNTQYPHPFTSLSDVTTITTQYFVRKNPVEAIMGTDGTIANWGGELIRDNFQISLMQNRGLNRGALVSYGKNIEGIEEDLDTDSICTRLMPVGKDGLLLAQKYIDSPYINNFPFPMIKIVDFSDCEDQETLLATAQAYMIANKIDIPQFNYIVSFIELSKTEEYKDYAVLERVYMGDTITIRHKILGMDLQAKVIAITYNDLTGRIDKIELGSFKNNIVSSINNSIQEVKQEIVQVTSAYQLAIDNATDLITGTKGGNVVIRQDDNGKPYEIDVMDTADQNTCVNVWRWNLNGFAHSSTGFNGPFTVGITADGHIVGSLITALTINASQITSGEITASQLSSTIGNDLNLSSNTAITSKVSSNSIVSSINQSSESITINASKLNLNGYATFTNLTTAGQTTINGSNITGGIITGTDIRQVVGATLVNEFTKNANGGLLNIYDIYGNIQSVLGVESGYGTNTGGSLTLFMDGLKHAVDIGATTAKEAGFITMFDYNGTARVSIQAKNVNNNSSIALFDANGTERSNLTETQGVIGGQVIATENWVNSAVSAAINTGKQTFTYWQGTIPKGNSMTINHYLGYPPIIDISCSSNGTYIMSHVHTNNSTTVFNSASSAGDWSGMVRLY